MRSITDEEIQYINNRLANLNLESKLETQLNNIKHIIRKLKDLDPTTLKDFPKRINDSLELIKTAANKANGTVQDKVLYKLACKAQSEFNRSIKQRMLEKSVSSPENLRNRLLTQLKLALQSFEKIHATDEYQAKSLQNDMNDLVKNLVRMVDNFKLKELAYENFKIGINAELNNDQSNKLKEPNSPYYEFHYAVASVFRGIFRLFDLGWIIGRKTMNETYTPFAKTFTGNNHFFELPQKSVQKEMAALTQEVKTKIEKLDELFVDSNNDVRSEFKA